MDEKRCRIVLADDHNLIRHGLKNMIGGNDDMLVVGEVSSGEELLALLDVETVDLVILDISMKKIGGLEAAGIIKSKYPWIKILMLTMHDTIQYFQHAIHAGADGYLVKVDSEEELMIAIRKVQEGRNYISPVLAEEFTEDIINTFRGERKSPFLDLTKREKEILQLVVDGLTSREMAEKLNLSPRTVDHHRANLLRKSKMKNSVDLVNFAVRNGLATPTSF